MRKIVISLITTIFAFIAATASSFAWMELSKENFVSDFSFSTIGETEILISYNNGHYYSHAQANYNSKDSHLVTMLTSPNCIDFFTQGAFGTIGERTTEGYFSFKLGFLSDVDIDLHLNELLIDDNSSFTGPIMDYGNISIHLGAAIRIGFIFEDEDPIALCPIKGSYVTSTDYNVADGQYESVYGGSIVNNIGFRYLHDKYMNSQFKEKYLAIWGEEGIRYENEGPKLVYAIDQPRLTSLKANEPKIATVNIWIEGLSGAAVLDKGFELIDFDDMEIRFKGVVPVEE